jgi:DNA-binding MarR family transcriptional regulator
MTGRARREVRRKKHVQGIEDEAFVTLQRAADALMQDVAAALKPMGLSTAQYNVLRILRGAEPDPLACREIADRMITRDPDITRLLDRLEDRGLVVRSRERADRRVITTRITAKGLHLLKELDGPIGALHKGQLGHLGIESLRSLIDLLEAVRSKTG